MKRAIATVLAAVFAIAVTGSAVAHGGGDHKVGLCHRTASDTNPYVFIEVDQSAVNTHLHNGPGHPPKTNPDGSPRNDYLAQEESECSQPSATPTPEPTPSSTPSAEPSLTPSPTPSSEPSPSPSVEPSEEPTPEPTATPTPEPSETPIPTPSSTPTSQPSSQPTAPPTDAETTDVTPGGPDWLFVFMVGGVALWTALFVLGNIAENKERNGRR